MVGNGAVEGEKGKIAYPCLHMKRYPCSLAIREMEVKIAMRNDTPSLQKAKCLPLPNAGEKMEKQLPHTAGRRVTGKQVEGDFAGPLAGLHLCTWIPPLQIPTLPGNRWLHKRLFLVLTDAVDRREAAEAKVLTWVHRGPPGHGPRTQQLMCLPPWGGLCPHTEDPPSHHLQAASCKL